MTAIHGVWSRGEADPAGAMRRQAAALGRFGGDLDASWSDGDVALGYSRILLLDEDRLPSPIAGADRRYAVVADLHLTEREALAEALGLGDRLSGLSDTALAAAALERWNEAAFDRLYGAFAIAAWDRQEHRLLLARDHLGSRPLFFHRASRRLAFASMPEGLRVLDGVSHDIDVDEYARFLRCHEPRFGRTPLAGIDRVMPGHYAVATADALTQHRWWTPDLTPLTLDGQDAYVAALRERLDAAVAASLRGVGRRVASQLSAGFDSTAVTVTAARQMAAHGGEVIAFTAAPRAGHAAGLPAHELADESGPAAETAAMHPNIEHVVLRRDWDPTETLERAASIHAMPVLNLCNLTWVDAINDAVRDRGLTVLLEGTMGNASLSESGVTALYELLRGGRWLTWARIARGLVRRGVMRPQGVLWNSLGNFLPSRLWTRIEGLFGRHHAPAARWSLLRADKDAAVMQAIHAENERAGVYDRLTLDEVAPRYFSSVRSRLEMLSFDFGAHYKARLAQWGIDTRDPTGDRRLIEWALRVPAERHLWDGEPRALLRRVLDGAAPPALLNSRSKGQQSSDWAASLVAARSALEREVERIELSDDMAAMIDVDRLKALLRDWPAADSPFWRSEEAAIDYRYALLRTVSAAAHLRKAKRSNL